MLNNAAEYARWRQKINQHPTTALVAAGQTMVDRAVIELLAADQFYGEVLTRLPRKSARLKAAFALTWQSNQLILQFSASHLAQTFPRFDSLQAGLKHVALHIVWQHPLRYRQQLTTQRQLVTLATDLAVNQYVDGLPAGMTSLSTAQALVKTPLPLKADSSVYLKLLQPAPSPAKSASQPGPSATGQAPQKSVGHQPAPQLIDDPSGWQASSGQLTNPNLAANRLQQLTHDAWTHTQEAGRGLVAGQVVAHLKVRQAPAALNWRRLLVRGLGQIPSGKKPSRARFNRRQPARMELPGQISELRLNVQVYVDNSGSISDQTLQYLLSQVASLTRAMAVTITVKPFDAIVQPGQTYQASLPQQVRFVRQGGGGTVYQSIFDDLAQHHVTNRSTLALILTDGRGERTVATAGFTNVIWLLAHATDHLSVQPVIGQVVTLQGGTSLNG
ncbi:VWA-like domain-containing protein [Lactiplantibacillus sp. WILCCON 0030]|uniref:VWA-like domain-containing protein n=1 Tax=Lactiplantibacillus brownii TaxID=3069269 RepID=A0ABU1ACI4_9LACO|nr:VWA-like domain-containing protein [Lactiplantibacillus brownii]MDQ7938621.1 VWA-like domain-containing protein [Lactiplantibacillus brownii]